MRLEKKPYEIILEDAQSFTLNSTDNIVSYDVEYFQSSKNQDRYSPTSKHGIRVFLNDEEIRSAVVCEVGGATGIHTNSALIIQDDLFICCCDNIYCLSIPNLDLKWNKRVDPATCFSIYHFKDDLVIHGELQISRIDFEGNEKWTFAARDIFVAQDGTECFSIQNDKIHVKDWGGYEYILDENGKTIS